MSKQLVFLCGARDFHAMDWYKSAKELLPEKDIIVLTDLIAGEGFKKITTEKDTVAKLLILDKFLFRNQSKIGNLWRNILKMIVFPIQVVLIKRFAKKHRNAIYHAHSMYYLFLARAAGIPYVGTPQGSDILVKPFKSKLYRYFSVKSLQAAKAVTVDSEKMKEKTFELSGVQAHIIQNGIDIDNITSFLSENKISIEDKKDLLSIRGFAPLYRIVEILEARNNSVKYMNQPIKFIYPFYENDYKNEIVSLMKSEDSNIGRVDREVMYSLLNQSKLLFSIPSSDSSPRSVYEAIFCGCAVVIAHHPYYDILPDCMKSRIILADISTTGWIDFAIEQADQIVRNSYVPSEEALNLFDQKRSFKRMEKLLFD